MDATSIGLVLMAAAVLAALAAPLLSRGGRDRRVTRGPSELDALLRRKAMLYANMKDLEFEFEMGKLSETDFQRLREEDRAEAARILSEIDTLEDRGDVDAIIEREIAARADGSRPAAARPARAETQTAPLPAAPAAAPPADAPVRGVARFCPACGAPVHPTDRFCAQCGQAIRAGIGA
jgi:hypothetical protein